MQVCSRREALAHVGTSTAVAAVGLLRPAPEALANEAAGWRYVPLDPDATARRAYAAFPGNGCCYAVAASILGPLAERFGPPYKEFPLEMMKYGNGGVAGLGSLCGVMNAGAAMMGLFVTDGDARGELTRTLGGWLETAELPVFSPESDGAHAVPRSPGASILCDAALTAWKTATGLEETGERCRRVTADGARKTVELLNAHASSLRAGTGE